MTASRKHILLLGPLLVSGGALLWLYWQYNPYEAGFFPVCTFRTLTGFTCPGCGSQRCLHFLLHLDLANALRENAFLVAALPYLFLLGISKGIGLDRRLPRLRQFLYGARAVKFLLLVLLVFWVGRNLLTHLAA